MLHKYHLSLNEKLNVGGLMNQVEPIKHKEEIYQMYKVLQERTQRDYLFFKFAIHTGVKLTELLNMKVKYLKMAETGNIKTAWIVDYEPSIKIMLPTELQLEIKSYIEEHHLKDEDLVFRSMRTQQCLSRQQAYRIIHQAAARLGMRHIGLTTLRKTFAYHAYQSGISISIIQKYLGHQTTQETMKFIGIKDKSIKRTVIALNL